MTGAWLDWARATVEQDPVGRMVVTWIVKRFVLRATADEEGHWAGTRSIEAGTFRMPCNKLFTGMITK
jgi:hypothetical protein